MKKILISLLILAIMIPAITACVAVPTSVAANGEFSVDSASSSQTATLLPWITPICGTLTASTSVRRSIPTGQVCWWSPL